MFLSICNYNFFRKVKLAVYNERRMKAITNVCGTIRGNIEPGKYLINGIYVDKALLHLNYQQEFNEHLINRKNLTNTYCHDSIPVVRF